MTNQNPITAVEWLVNELELDSNHPLIKKVVEEAKETEKTFIIRAYEAGKNDGWNTRENHYNKNGHKEGTGEQWYDYTFNYKYGQIINN